LEVGKIQIFSKRMSFLFSIAQVSTASLGKFDKKSHNKEPKIKAKIHHTKPNFTTVKDERRRDLDILKIISKNS